MMNSKLWKWIYVALTLPLLGLSQNVAASLEGTFTGSANITLQCLGPAAGPVTVTGSAVLVANGTTANITLEDSAGDYRYSGTGSIAQTGTNTFSFSFSGPALINTGNNILDGGYTSFVNLDVSSSDSVLTRISADNVETFPPTPATNCANIKITTAISSLSSSNATVVTSDSPGSTVTESVLFNTQIQNAVSGISNRVVGALASVNSPTLRPSFSDNEFKLEGMTGLNAGEGIGIPYGMWGNYSYTNYENDLSSTAFDGSSHGFLGGIDFGIFENTVLGVAFGYEFADIDTDFNSGNQDTDTFVIAPYFGAILSDMLSVDFNFGYSHVGYDQYRTIGSTRVTSSPEADRWFGAFNLNAITYEGNWVLGARTGMLYASSTIESFTESNGTLVAENQTRLSSVNIAGDIAYMYGNFEPFLNLVYQYDFQFQEVIAATGPQPENDKDDLLLTVGVRYFESSGISGNIEYSKRITRADYDEDRISLTLRIDY
ncbi:MAG: autotransporter outer membrane beta-barrel domain-containing protein [Proteobacteria bacterium]|nr:autotransporter outer membrane beta-barrel domain-containing protein [Pseudomonadota bacterium]